MRIQLRYATLTLAMVLALGLATSAVAQEEQSLANKTANPLGGDFILLINQYDFIVKAGDLLDQSVNPLAPSDAYANAYTFQPVISAPLDNYFGPGYSVVVRPTFQFLFDTDIPSTPTPGGIPFISEDGWADPSVFGLIGKTTPTSFGGGGVTVIGAGVAASFPWGSDAFSSDQYSLGPAAVATYIGKHFVAGGLAQQFWSVSDNGNSSAPDVNKTLLQYFYYYNITPSLQLGASPLATLDYENGLYQFP